MISIKTIIIIRYCVFFYSSFEKLCHFSRVLKNKQNASKYRPTTFACSTIFASLPIFQYECTGMQNVALKIYFFPGSRPPDPHGRRGEPAPSPRPAQSWCPSASLSLAIALFQGYTGKPHQLENTLVWPTYSTFETWLLWWQRNY